MRLKKILIYISIVVSIGQVRCKIDELEKKITDWLNNLFNTSSTLSTTLSTTSVTEPSSTNTASYTSSSSSSPTRSTWKSLISTIHTSSNSFESTTNRDSKNSTQNSTTRRIYNYTYGTTATTEPSSAFSSTNSISTTSPFSSTTTRDPRYTSTNTNFYSSSRSTNKSGISNFTTFETTHRTSTGRNFFSSTSTTILEPTPIDRSRTWNATYDNNSYCIMMQLTARINISYTNTKNRNVKTGFNIPANATTNPDQSECSVDDKSDQRLTLDFRQDNILNGQIMFVFTKENQKFRLSDINVSFRIRKALFSNINSSYIGKTILLLVRNISKLEANVNHSYECDSSININFSSIDIRKNMGWVLQSMKNDLINSAILEIRNVQVQAFMPRDRKINDFMEAEVCKQDQNDDDDDDDDDDDYNYNQNDGNDGVIPVLTERDILALMFILLLIGYSLGRGSNSSPKRHASMHLHF